MRNLKVRIAGLFAIGIVTTVWLGLPAATVDEFPDDVHTVAVQKWPAHMDVNGERQYFTMEEEDPDALHANILIVVDGSEMTDEQLELLVENARESNNQRTVCVTFKDEDRKCYSPDSEQSEATPNP